MSQYASVDHRKNSITDAYCNYYLYFCYFVIQSTHYFVEWVSFLLILRIPFLTTGHISWNFYLTNNCNTYVDSERYSQFDIVRDHFKGLRLNFHRAGQWKFLWHDSYFSYFSFPAISPGLRVEPTPTGSLWEQSQNPSSYCSIRTLSIHLLHTIVLVELLGSLLHTELQTLQNIFPQNFLIKLSRNFENEV